jgi:hypothetical protein
MADKEKDTSSRDLWDRLELLSKVVGGVSIPIFGLILSYMLHAQTESSQKAQLYATITTSREKADSDVRSEMFSRLLDRYLGPSGSGQATLAEARDRVMFLDLLRANFEEYFNARPLFSRLYEQIRNKEAQVPPEERAAWTALRQRLVEIAKDTTSRQVARLVRSGHLTEDIVVPVGGASSEQPVSRRIALYPTRGLSGLTDLFKLSEDEWSPAEPDRDPAKRYSITIRVKEMLESSTKVSVLLYRDMFDRRQFKPAQSLPDLRPIEFEVSYFSTPYMDNTRLFDGSRFSVLYDGCIDANAPDEVCHFPLAPSAQPKAQFKVVVFDEAFLSQRDRPYVDQILEKIGKTPAR